MQRDINWKCGEYIYATEMVRDRGNKSVGYDPKTVATYLRLQASAVCRAEQFELSARMGAAATAINEDARNDHAPDWTRAYAIMYAAMAPV